MSFKVHGRSWVDGQCVCQSPFQVLDGYNHDDGSNVGIDIDIDREAGLLIVGSEGCALKGLQG